MAVALACDIPHLVYPTMRVMIPLIWKQSYHETSLLRKALTVAGKVHLVTLMSAMVLSIGAAYTYTLVLEVVGLLSCVYISGILPCTLYLKQASKNDPKWLWWTTVVVLIGTTCTGLVAFVCFVNFHGSYY